MRSLRVRAMGVVLLTAASPLLVVLAVNIFDSNLESKLGGQVATTAYEAAKIVRDIDHDLPSARLQTLARRHHQRIRIIHDDIVVFDENADPARGLVGLVSTAFFGPDGAPTLAAYDAARPPLGSRRIIHAASALPDVHCSTSDQRRLLVCSAAVRLQSGDVVLVQESTRRAIRALYDVRYQLLKLLLLTLPVLALLAWWLGWRMVLPVERLRRQVLHKVREVDGVGRSAHVAADLEVNRQDEFGDLAQAFNTLLDRLQTRDRANEEFLQDLVHEAKSPVAAIRAASESLASGREIDDARAQRLARVLDHASARLDDVVTEVLELARAEGGLRGEERLEVDLATMIRGLVTAIEDDVRYRELSFEVDVPAKLLTTCVPGRVETALRNLVSNAASFAVSGGGHVVIRAQVHAREICIDVEDDGPGMSPDVLRQVFDRFFTRRKSGRGDGIGLALVRAVALAHGGHVVATSTEGEGACFSFRLPTPTRLAKGSRSRSRSRS